jgi:hypothetical protein
MSRTRAAAALPSVIGGPGSDFIPACRAAYLVATAYRLMSHLWLREGDRVARKRRECPRGRRPNTQMCQLINNRRRINQHERELFLVCYLHEPQIGAVTKCDE